MTVKECYSQMNGDYNNVLSRFYDEAMIKRLLGRFIDDTSFRALEQAMAEGDVQAAFNAAHTLRGGLSEPVVYPAVRHAGSHHRGAAGRQYRCGRSRHGQGKAGV